MKRSIADVRNEIRQLESDITHEVISRAAMNDHTPSERQTTLERQLALLKSTYPHWDRTQQPKG